MEEDDYPDELIGLLDDDEGPPCAACGGRTEWERCYQCGGEGVDGHDCGEDVCCCLEPEENEVCEVCRGDGGWWACCTPSAEGHH